MIENIIGCIICFFIGTIYGIIDEYNNKIAFVIWILCVVFSIFAYFNNPVQYSSSFDWWFIPNIICMFFGMRNGIFMYKINFGDKK